MCSSTLVPGVSPSSSFVLLVTSQYVSSLEQNLVVVLSQHIGAKYPGLVVTKSQCVSRDVSLLRANHPAGVLHPCQPISVLPVCQRTNQRPFLPTAEWFYFRQAESGFCCRAASRANTNTWQKKYTPHRVELVGEEIQIRAREIKKCATIVPVYGSNSYYRFVSECECW